MKDRPKGRPGARQMRVREKEMQREHERRQRQLEKKDPPKAREVKEELK